MSVLGVNTFWLIWKTHAFDGDQTYPNMLFFVKNNFLLTPEQPVCQSKHVCCCHNCLYCDEDMSVTAAGSVALSKASRTTGKKKWAGCFGGVVKSFVFELQWQGAHFSAILPSKCPSKFELLLQHRASKPKRFCLAVWRKVTMFARQPNVWSILSHVS